MIATKLAAVGPEAQGKKEEVVVFLSPGWFLAPELDHPGFGVNFSPLHAGIFAFESHLSAPLKQALARRLLDYPGDHQPVAPARPCPPQPGREHPVGLSPSLTCSRRWARCMTGHSGNRTTASWRYWWWQINHGKHPLAPARAGRPAAAAPDGADPLAGAHRPGGYDLPPPAPPDLLQHRTQNRV